ncbi:acyl-coenzyme A diphosphatase FITM2 [Anabrus simplex]|uniref:acyl-coenzyme A diphosphatase FITM2 n=1 Tax=Anabrus simplex TaxID=316456 RepID=UPI0034DD6446
MATKRRPIHPTSKLNFRPSSNNAEASTCEGKSKKPLPDQPTIPHVLLMMVLHVCRKTLFIDTSVKVGIYGASLFIISVIADVAPIPKTYFARSDNLFNQYFVKLGWGWTLLVTFPFLVLTSYTYCCGRRDRVVQHLMRLGVSTCCWFFWVRLFQYIESSYGRCLVSKPLYSTKSACISNGYFWNGFDISGHAFILIYSSLVLIEEARAINGWEGIRDLIRDEEHSRSVGDKSAGNKPLRNLSNEEFLNLKESYEKFTPYIRCLFIAMTCLVVLWDIMLVSTMLYYHIMIEKFISGAIAILMWYVTYRYWYTIPKVLPCLPGEGLFKYKDAKVNKDIPLKRKGTATNNAKGNLPTFMGMPLYGLKNQDTKEPRQDKDENADNESESFTSFGTRGVLNT